MTTDIFCFYLQNRLIQTCQTGGQWYSDTSPFSIPCQGPCSESFWHYYDLSQNLWKYSTSGRKENSTYSMHKNNSLQLP